MSADTDLRAAYRALADSAPSLDALTIPGTGQRSAATRRVRGQRLAVVATVAAIALIVSVLVVTGHRHHSEPAQPPSDPAYSWQYGVHSMPGYVPTEREIGPNETTYNYAQIPTDIRKQTPGGRAVLTTFVPGAAARSTVATLTRATVGRTAAWAGTLTSAARCTALHLSSMYCPGSVAVWPDASGQRWVVLQAAPQFGRLVTPLATLTADQTVALADTIRTETSAGVAAVRVGYVPAGMRLTSVHELVVVHAGLAGKGSTLDMFFAAPTGDATVHIQVTPQRRVDLNSASPAAVGEYGTGPWTKTSIAGRTAWRSVDYVLMQFGKSVVVIDNLSEAGGTGHDSTTPVAELLKVAASLSHVVPVDSKDGSTLPQAIPAGALW